MYDISRRRQNEHKPRPPRPPPLPRPSAFSRHRRTSYGSLPSLLLPPPAAAHAAPAEEAVKNVRQVYLLQTSSFQLRKYTYVQGGRVLRNAQHEKKNESFERMDRESKQGMSASRITRVETLSRRA